MFNPPNTSVPLPALVRLIAPVVVVPMMPVNVPLELLLPTLNVTAVVVELVTEPAPERPSIASLKPARFNTPVRLTLLRLGIELAAPN